jgi:hypothetical protein
MAAVLGGLAALSTTGVVVTGPDLGPDRFGGRGSWNAGSAKQTMQADVPSAERTVPPPTGREITPHLIEIDIGPERVLRILLACIAGLIAIGTLNAALSHVFGHRSFYGLAPLFRLYGEPSVPALFSSLMLFLAAGLLGAATLRHRRSRSRWTLHWGLLALGFAWLGIDEAVGFHELLSRPTRELLHTPGIAFAWIIPASLVVIGLAVLYLPFLHALPRKHAWRFLGSGLLYVGGALGMEAIGSVIMGLSGEAFIYQVEVIVEEGCEMLGVACFIYSLLLYLREQDYRLRFRIAENG